MHKADMVIQYIMENYQGHEEALCRKIAPAVQSPNFSVSEIKGVIDKIAAFNGWITWGKLDQLLSERGDPSANPVKEKVKDE